jgi:hypothetical protein
LIPGKGWKFFSSPSRSDPLWGPLSLLYNGYWRLITPEKGRDTYYSSPSSAEVKMRGALPSLPQYVVMVWYSVKDRESISASPDVLLRLLTLYILCYIQEEHLRLNS